jgi:hypothetical protein
MSAYKTGKGILANKRLSYLRKTVGRSTGWNIRPVRFVVLNVEITIVFGKTGLIAWYKSAIISDRLPAASIVKLYGESHLVSSKLKNLTFMVGLFYIILIS